MNTKSRIDNSIRNVKYTAIAQTVNFLIVFLSRRFFVKILSTEYLGLNGTFSNIISMLSLAELGLGSAICFCLYKPISDKDEKTVNSIMAFYKKAYTVIGLAVLAIGTALIPFLDFIIEELPNIPHIRLIYFLFVFNSSLSYFFVYKKTLLIADQKQYLSNIIHQVFVFLINLLQIILLLITHNYFAYLLVMIVGTVSQNVFISVLVDKEYDFLDTRHADPLDSETKKEIFRKIGAMASHRVGGVIVNGTDNIIIAKCVSVISVGLYSNYFLVKNTVISVITLLFQAVTSSVGNLGAQENSEKRRGEVFDALNLTAAIVVGLCSVGMFVLFNPFIELWVGREYLLNPKTVAVIVLNFYILGMRQPVLTFRDALGIFWHDRYKPVAESVINLVFSIPLAFRYGILGVLLGTLISTMTTSFWVEPYVLYKYGFKRRVYSYFIKYFVYFAVTAVSTALCLLICSYVKVENSVVSLIIKGLICLAVTGALFLIAYFRTPAFKTMFGIFQKKVLKNNH